MKVVNGLDAAIIGYTHVPGRGVAVAVYDANLCIAELMQANEWDEDEAHEYFCFNILDAYVGKDSPLFVWPCDRDTLEHVLEAEMNSSN